MQTLIPGGLKASIKKFKNLPRISKRILGQPRVQGDIS